MREFFKPFLPPYDLKLVWALVPFALLGISLGMMPLRSWDYWWHISFGRVIASTGEMPLFNHFLYTLPADTPSYVQAWLSQASKRPRSSKRFSISQGRGSTSTT